jgi:hypothetical protein
LSKVERAALAEQKHGLLDLLKIPSADAMVKLLADLPDETHQRLLNDGYLKWSYPTLDEPRRAAFAKIQEQLLSVAAEMGFAPKGRTDLAAQVLRETDVGFAVLHLKGNAQTVCFYMLSRHAAIPSVMPLACSDPQRLPEMKELQLEAERMLRDKPHSPLPTKAAAPTVESVPDENRLRGK